MWCSHVENLVIRHTLKGTVFSDQMNTNENKLFSDHHQHLSLMRKAKRKKSLVIQTLTENFVDGDMGYL